MATLCSCKNYQEKGMEGGRKGSLHWFLADQKIVSSWKKCVLGHPIAQATSYCLLQTHSDFGPPKMPLKLACKICKFTVTSFHCEEGMHQKYKQPRDLSDARQRSKEWTALPELPSKVLGSASWNIRVASITLKQVNNCFIITYVFATLESLA